MSAAGKVRENKRGKDSGRTGAAGRAAVYITTMSCSLNTEDILYNDNEDVLILAGLDPEKMEYLPAAERKRLLEEAGLDPVKFDF